jgi:hypothetical protein
MSLETLILGHTIWDFGVGEEFLNILCGICVIQNEIFRISRTGNHLDVGKFN